MSDKPVDKTTKTANDSPAASPAEKKERPSPANAQLFDKITKRWGFGGEGVFPGGGRL